jgi:iron complex outermembrane receptor protein
MFSRVLLFLIGLLFLLPRGISQECTLQIHGHLTDVSTGKPVEFVSIYVKELQDGTISDIDGVFELNNLCHGSYHLVFSHVGCATQELFVTLSRDTVLAVQLDHNSTMLHEVQITGQISHQTIQVEESISDYEISTMSSQNMANMLENLSGVSSVKTGNNISKPVVNGLTGNRLAIINNGLVQSGQQWGADHAPEIDPLMANKITVVKGVSAIEYQGSSLGSVILMEPRSIEKDPHLHGKAGYFFQSNGFGNGVHLLLQKYSNTLAWRVSGTLKRSGDLRTSSYYLNNTGAAEANMAVQLEKSISKRWKADLYFSSFNSNLGILRGSQIGNLSDLEEAFARPEPFYTEEIFSYSIDAPYQNVHHHLGKLHTTFKKSETEKFDFTYGFQLNQRKEFDIIRGGRSDEPAMSLKQYTNFLEGKYSLKWGNQWKLKSGIQYTRKDNTNIPETGVLPLIPDYISENIGVYGMIFKRVNKLLMEWGGRYDYTHQNVAAISMTYPREIVRYENKFQNYNFMAGVQYMLDTRWSLSYSIGMASRNPEVNELYSNGLHQGVSGIEEGDPNLVTEYGLKNSLSIKGEVAKRLFVEGLFYTQNISNYIYLQPEDEFRLTIRGAFPVFKYTQADSRISGFDVSGTYEVSDSWMFSGQYSFLWGWNVEENIPLVYMPSNNLTMRLGYRIPHWKKWENLEMEVNDKLVFEQKNLLPSQDYVVPPPTYNLLGAKVSLQRQLARFRLHLYGEVTNVLNVSYRDYLNRQRYFADDLGINLIVGARVSF